MTPTVATLFKYAARIWVNGNKNVPLQPGKGHVEANLILRGGMHHSLREEVAPMLVQEMASALKTVGGKKYQFLNNHIHVPIVYRGQSLGAFKLFKHKNSHQLGTFLAPGMRNNLGTPIQEELACLPEADRVEFETRIATLGKRLWEARTVGG